MIYIFLGEDSVQSRNEFIRIKNEKASEKTIIHEINDSNIDQLSMWMDESQSLFGETNAFFAENMLAKKEYRDIFKKYDTPDKTYEIYIWEEKMEDRVAKFLFKHASLKSYKLSETIFKLLDELYPSNATAVLPMFQSITENTEEYLLFFMICKRVRELIIIKQGGLLPKLASWQTGRMSAQAKKWDEKKLLNFYESLYNIDALQKTSKTVYSIKNALEILFVYYL